MEPTKNQIAEAKSLFSDNRILWLVWKSAVQDGVPHDVAVEWAWEYDAELSE
jgi:hypothetical protein